MTYYWVLDNFREIYERMSDTQKAVEYFWQCYDMRHQRKWNWCDKDCSVWASDKVCQYCDYYAYFRDAYRCDIDDQRVSPNYYCYRFKG